MNPMTIIVNACTGTACMLIFYMIRSTVNAQKNFKIKSAILYFSIRNRLRPPYPRFEMRYVFKISANF